MQLEPILFLGEGKRYLHQLRAELRSSCYRLLCARNERVARWLMDRVKVGLLIVADDSELQLRTQGHIRQRSSLPDDNAVVVPGRPTLVISHQEHVHTGFTIGAVGCAGAQHKLP